MDDSDLSISLNINAASLSRSYNGPIKKKKVVGCRHERIKKRKQLKYEQQKTALLEADNSQPVKRKQLPPDTLQDEDSSAPPKKLPRKDGPNPGAHSHSHSGPKKPEKGVISSLFRHNPDIPTVKSQSVKAVKEEVFASTKFSDLPLHPHLISNLEKKMELATMTRVQQLSIPVILQEKDVLIKSQTGSGKTLAYAVPLVHTLANLPRKIQRSNGPFALVIVPTRELALQSYETFNKLLQSAVWIVAGCLMGGENRKTEKARIRRGINILVSTPGRLLDHLKHTDCLHLDRVRCLIIDEADRLLEMGYEKDIAQIVTILNERCQEQRQTILLSATLSAGVERLSGVMLTNHQSIDASAKMADSQAATDPKKENSSEDSTFTVPEKLKQHFVVVPCKLRLVTLASFILWKCKQASRKSKMVVFLNTQDSVEFHHQLFTELFLKSDPPHTELDGQASSHQSLGVDDLDLFRLHGDMDQKDRTQVFQDFTEASSGVLLCTDVASRGLHLPKVDWIVQYTPGPTVDYIHRVGRTARAGKQGNALLFLMPSETGYIQELNKHKINLSEMSMKDILLTLLSAVHDLPQPLKHTMRELPRTYEEASTYLQDRFEESVLRNHQLQTLAAKGYQSFVRAYATFPSHLKEIFTLKDLHLGHVAKTFALREAPSHIHGAANRGRSKTHKPKGNRRLEFDPEGKGFGKFQKKRPLSATVSEYGSGFVSNKGVATKHKKNKNKNAFG